MKSGTVTFQTQMAMLIRDNHAPQKVKKTKCFGIEQFTTPPFTRPIPTLQLGPGDAARSTTISFGDSYIVGSSLNTPNPLQSLGSAVESPSHVQTSAPCDTPHGQSR